jgi:hypothetical protein
MISMGLIAVLMTLALVVVVLGLYWLPSILAWFRQPPDLFSVVVLNGLLGWTLVGWVVALGRVMRPTGAHVATQPPYPRGYQIARRSPRSSHGGSPPM